MKKPRKVHEAIAVVFKELGPEPKSSRELLEAIESHNLYPFLTTDKLGVVKRELRRHTVGVDFKSASTHKRYEQDANGRFRLLHRTGANPNTTNPPDQASRAQLLLLHAKHLEATKHAIAASLKQIEPYRFEHFAKCLVEAYGFYNVQVTRRSADGGIDGHGRIRFGMAEISAAFQCKRYTTTSVGLPAINEFRGAASGPYQLGIFFTTSKFTKQAIKHSIKEGAVPIALMDGMQIAQLMIERGLAVIRDDFPVYTYLPDALFE